MTYFKKGGTAPDVGEKPSEGRNIPVPAPARTIVAPHAPSIEVNQQETTVWGEDTKLIALTPGKTTTVYAMKLYSNMATYPESSCLGPAYIIYTWQVRDPYPEGGDLEIRSVHQGGGTDQVALGAMGRARMGPCEEHIFKNNGLQPMRIVLFFCPITRSIAGGCGHQRHNALGAIPFPRRAGNLVQYEIRSISSSSGEFVLQLQEGEDRFDILSRHPGHRHFVPCLIDRWSHYHTSLSLAVDAHTARGEKLSVFRNLATCAGPAIGLLSG